MKLSVVAVALAFSGLMSAAPNIAFGYDNYSWRQHLDKKDKDAINTWLDVFAMSTAMMAGREAACREVIPREDSQEGFLEPLEKRHILRFEDPAISTMREKYVAWQNMTKVSSDPCNRKELSSAKEARDKALLRLDFIKLKAMKRELDSLQH